MSHIFYFFGIFAIIWEFLVMCSPKKAHKFITNMKPRKWGNYDDSEKFLSFMILFYAIWTFVGLMSSQWIAFLALILLSVVVPKKTWWIRMLDAALSFAILMFLLINKYHLHIDMLSMIRKWMNI